MMTTILSKAFHQAAKLSTHEQKIFAKWMLQLLESEQRWNELSATPRSQDVLSLLADEALEEFYAGKTELLDVQT